MSGLVDRVYDWLEKPIHRLVLGVLAHTVYTSSAVILLIYVIELLFDARAGQKIDTIIISVVITLVISLILHSRSFLISWRTLAIDSEKMKKEAMTAKYEALKNQVNPHFLFNSLNALTNLVYEDQDLAAKFIKKLSEVYRYVLESRDKEVVLLSEELKFVDSYIFLQKIRHEDALNVSFNIDKNSQFNVVPLSLQMLIENAIKHNIVSDEDPLTIHVEADQEFLKITNNLQKKNSYNVEHIGVGLENIKARYQFLTEKPVEVEESQDKFEVRLPLLSIK